MNGQPSKLIATGRFGALRRDKLISIAPGNRYKSNQRHRALLAAGANEAPHTTGAEYTPSGHRHSKRPNRITANGNPKPDEKRRLK